MKKLIYLDKMELRESPRLMSLGNDLPDLPDLLVKQMYLDKMELREPPRLMILGNDLLVKQAGESQFKRLKNIQLERYYLNKEEAMSRCVVESLSHIKVKPFIRFNMEVLTESMEETEDSFDYREELIKEIYRDLNK